MAQFTGGMRIGTGSGLSIGGSIARIARQGRAVANRALLGTAAVLQAEIIQTLSTPGRGRLRRQPAKVRRWLRSKNEKVRAKGAAFAQSNRVSLPGDPPAPDVGRLRASITIDRVSVFVVRVGTNVEYAPWLEYGTARLKKRPFMRPSWMRVERVLRTRGVFGKLLRDRI